MAENVLCPGCSHPVRRHSAYGCMAAAGACECVLPRADIEGEADLAEPELTPAVPPAPPRVEVKPPAAPKPPAVPEPARAPDLAIRPQVETLRSSVESILARAKAAGGKYAQRAEKVRGLVVELDGDLAEHQRVADAEKRVEDLRAELAKANEDLRAARQGPTKAAERGKASASLWEIREWAWANGHECARIGVVPARVMEAYRAAHPEVGNA